MPQNEKPVNDVTVPVVDPQTVVALGEFTARMHKVVDEFQKLFLEGAKTEPAVWPQQMTLDAWLDQFKTHVETVDLEPTEGSVTVNVADFSRSARLIVGK